MKEKIRKRVETQPPQIDVIARSHLETLPIKPHATPMPSSERDPLDLIAEEFAEACRRGKTPSVSDFLVKYPVHAEDLKDLLPAVGQMESLKKIRRAASTATMTVPDAIPARIGDYKILREIGRGGMGIVYEAEQASLGRRVALKILPRPARAEQDKRDRFLREAQAAARLHHTNIVPVFGVGEDDGTPYYVMQIIRGCGLDDVIHAWKDPKTDSDEILRKRDWRTIARLMSKAADALDYAHSEGVLHRDIKPGNLLLDASGHLWVTDFGLAKILHESTLTGTGAVLGTLQYMAPESLAGQSDARTDVYGLGMVLYELLTGRMPFDETNPAILVKQIGTKEPPAPHAFMPKVPRDLETICLKAIAREASRRYATAGDLADDLRAYLTGRPISARRLSVAGRGWLWCKRNPAVSGSLAATALILAGSAVFGWSMYAKARTALASESDLRRKEKLLLDEQTLQFEREASLRREAVEANKKYHASLHLSLQSLEKILDEIATAENMSFAEGPEGRGPGGAGGRSSPPPEGPRPGGESQPPFGKGPPPDRKGPGFRPEQGPGPAGGPGGGPRQAMISSNAKLLEQILSFFEKFAEQNQTNPKLKFDAARAYRKVGEFNHMMGNHEKGDAFTNRAVALFREIENTHDDPDKVRAELDLIRNRGPVRRLLP